MDNPNPIIKRGLISGILSGASVYFFLAKMDLSNIGIVALGVSLLPGILFGILVMFPWSKFYIKNLWLRFVYILTPILASFLSFAILVNISDASHTFFVMPFYALAGLTGAVIIVLSIFFLKIKNRLWIVFLILLGGALGGFFFDIVNSFLNNNMFMPKNKAEANILAYIGSFLMVSSPYILWQSFVAYSLASAKHT